jgi:hypothetical protein
VRDALLLDGVGERLRDVFLADDIGKPLRTVFSGDYLIGHVRFAISDLRFTRRYAIAPAIVYRKSQIVN